MAEKIFVKVKTGARQEGVERADERHYKVSVKARPVDGAANTAVIAMLAIYFRVPKSRIQLKSGASSTNKVFML